MVVKTNQPPAAPAAGAPRQINPAVGNRNQEMLDRRNLIADQADEVRGDDLEDLAEDTPAPKPPEEEPEPIVEEPAPPPQEEEEETPPVETPPAPVSKIKIKVNGREMELTQEELIERAQKVESADDYLRLSSEAFRRSLATPPSAPEPAAPAPDPDAVSDDDVALARALQMGDEVEAAKAVRRLRSAPSLSRDEIIRTVDARTASQRAFARFESEYSDIANDPRMMQLADVRDRELLASGDTRPQYERWAQIGKELQEWRGTPARSDEASRNALNARKASMNQVPAAATRQAARSEPEAEESTQETISKMAQARQGRPINRR